MNDKLTVTFKFEHGAEVKNLLTTETGIIIGRTDWVTGCNRYIVQPQGVRKGSAYDTFAADELALELIKKPTKAITAIVDAAEIEDPGGPSDAESLDDKDRSVVKK